MPRRKKIIEEKLSWSHKLAEKIAEFTGNIWFVWIHAILFAGWIVANEVMGDNGWDQYPYIFLVLVVSLEAIFLSTFVLMAQNRESRENEIRDTLDFEVDQRVEQEIIKLKKMVEKIAEDVDQMKKGR